MRVAVISDIHSNLTALHAVFDDIEQMGAVAIWCLGDLVGYGPEPNACVELVRERTDLCLGGNHDLAALGKMDLEYFNPDAAVAALWTAEVLTPASREFLGALPCLLQREPFTLAHGSPRHPEWEYILTYGVARANFELLETPYCLVGHTHWPTAWRKVDGDENSLECEPLVHGLPYPFAEDPVILNPGSVGQPRDGDTRASYLLLDTDARTATARRVAYPIEQTQALMRVAGLPQRLIDRLAAGW
jgi:predicted phosphodiesterase